MTGPAPVPRRHRDRWGRFAPAPLGPVVPDPLRFPTEKHPRYRLRVFDRCWPWRATLREAVRDAIASRNARRDREERAIFLDACAFIQQDPPPYLAALRWRTEQADES